MAPAPLILEIKGNALDDGPGIRTVVFFKGCPLDCPWCHNPESKAPQAEIAFETDACVDCGSCLDTCTADALSRQNPMFINRSRCNLCFDCVDNCPSGALERTGRPMEISEIIDRVMKDKPFFDTSKGGVTLSGGEPTFHTAWLGNLAKALKDKGIHVLLETCGQFNYETFMARVYPHVDMIYFDIKLMDPRTHKQYCGLPNTIILENFKRLHGRYLKGGTAILPRTPLVPGITDTQANLSAIIEFYKTGGVKRTQLLAYHPIWREKYKKMGIDPTPDKGAEMEEWMSGERLAACEKLFIENGIRVEP